MKYISTRGGAAPADFDTVLLAGLAPDGGLYVPKQWPQSSISLSALAEMSFAEAATKLLAPFFDPWINEAALGDLTEDAFSAFYAADVAPLVRIDEDDWLLELFHGPTLAFKDVAMQLLGRLFDRALQENGRRATIVGATSGDTGGAAIEAFRGRGQIDVVILHPKGRVSDVQRRMMTTATEPNIHNIAVNGTFDDCQKIIKTLFADQAFCDETSLSGVNSINWARLAVQTVYYFTALATLARHTGAATASFTVPTGNFGDAFAGYAALKMGAPISKLCIAVNQNDILHRALTTGVYRPTAAATTTSPSMDIQVASNFERLLFEASRRDAACVVALMTDLNANGSYKIPTDCLNSIRESFISSCASEEENVRTISEIYASTDMLIDPHTAVGIVATRKLRASGGLSGTVINLATAHPAKFPDAVIAATGQAPQLPARFRDLFELPEKYTELPPDAGAIKAMIRKNISGNT